MKKNVIHEGTVNIPERILIKKQNLKDPDLNQHSIELIKSEAKEKKTEKFLMRSADARMMDAAEGALAAERGTTKEIRNYGQLMITDQAKLLDQLKRIAELKGVVLPEKISNKKEYFLKKLSEKSGSDFDKKFIHMITKDHKRDVRMFRRAAKSDDTAISNFAQQFLPLIQSHLDQINQISR